MDWNKNFKKVLYALNSKQHEKDAAYLRPKAAKLLAKMLLVARVRGKGHTPTGTKLLETLREARKRAGKMR